MQILIFGYLCCMFSSTGLMGTDVNNDVTSYEMIKPMWPPVEEYIAAIEKACPKLEQGGVDELRVDVKKVLKKAQNVPRSPSNITREEIKALHELRKDKDRIILTTDKGVALLVMNKADYISKCLVPAFLALPYHICFYLTLVALCKILISYTVILYSTSILLLFLIHFITLCVC